MSSHLISGQARSRTASHNKWSLRWPRIRTRGQGHSGGIKGVEAGGPAGVWDKVRGSCRPAHPPISKKSPCGQHLPLSLEQSYLYPGQAPHPICGFTARTDTGIWQLRP